MDYVGAVIIIALLGVTAWALLSVGKSDLRGGAASQMTSPLLAGGPSLSGNSEVLADAATKEAAKPMGSSFEEGLNPLDEDESDMETVQASPEELKKILASVGTSGEE